MNETIDTTATAARSAPGPDPAADAPAATPGPPPYVRMEPPGGTIRSLGQRISNKVTKAIALHHGAAMPFWYVSEYPKSGGTWIANLLADYLGLPFPKHAALPVGCPAVIHNHWRHDPRLRRVLYLHRDGRDVMVSFYFMRMRITADPHNRYDRNLARRYERAFGAGYDPADSVRHLPTFIELEMTRPMQSRINWPTHVREWTEADPARVSRLSYESMLEEPVPTLGAALRPFLAEMEMDVDEARVAEVVERWSFRRMAGRRSGEEDRGSFLRKGVAGDWVNHFSREAADVFDAHAGDLLVALGHEADRGWRDRYDFAS